MGAYREPGLSLGLYRRRGAAVSSSLQASPGRGGNSTVLSPSWLHQGKGNSTILSRLLS